MGNKPRKNKKNAGKVAGIIVGLLAAGVVGYLLHMFTVPANNNTTIHVTIADNFGLSWNNTSFNSTYNCSTIGIDCVVFSRNVFAAMDAYFNANRSKLLGENNISSECGIHACTMGWIDEAFAPDMDYYGYPTNLTRCEGTTTTFTLGDNVVFFPVIYIAVWYNGSLHWEDFTFQPIDTLTNDLYYGVLNRTTWLNATQYMWRGVDDITIYDWQLDLDTLIVNFNGVNATMVSAMMP